MGHCLEEPFVRLRRLAELGQQGHLMFFPKFALWIPLVSASGVACELRRSKA